MHEPLKFAIGVVIGYALITIVWTVLRAKLRDRIRFRPKYVVRKTTNQIWVFVRPDRNELNQRIFSPGYHYFARVSRRLPFGAVWLAEPEYLNIRDFAKVS